MKSRGGKRWVVLWGALLLCAAVFVCSACLYFSSLHDYSAGEKAYAALSLQCVQPARTVAEQFAAEETTAANADEAATDPAPLMDFSTLSGINPDVAAWLSLPGTALDYPVVQGGDNSFYLNHMFSRESNRMGTLFIDCRCAKDFSGRNTVIYGHNMKNNSMFAILENYRTQSFYDVHGELLLYTPSGTYLLQPFSGQIITAELSNLPLSFADDDAFDAYVQNTKSASVFESGLTVSSQDQLVTLCTCSYRFENARFALICKASRVE